ncbi:32668_t:CDS:2, partial [Racocetra persica]
TDEELALVCRLLFYQPTGYHSNPENYRKILKQRDTSQVSYGKISRPNCVHMCDLLRLTNDTVNKKTYKWVLTVIDVAFRFKWA